MEEVRPYSSTASRTRSLAFVGLTIAIMAVSAWVSVPIGPVPITLQMFAIVFAIVVLSYKEALFAVAGYLVLGAVGVPVFSSMRGGIGVLAGPTGGFLWGYLFGVAAGALLVHAVRARTDWNYRMPEETGCASASKTSPLVRLLRFVRIAAIEISAGVLFTLISYVCGWAQYMAVAHVGPLEAFLVCCAPFIVFDAVKILAAVACARAVKAAVR